MGSMLKKERGEGDRRLFFVFSFTMNKRERKREKEEKKKSIEKQLLQNYIHK